MSGPDRDPDLQRARTAAGLSVSGSLLTGLGGIVGAFAMFLDGNYLGSGVFLIAAALAFGLLANAAFGR